LEACKTLRREISKITFADANNVLFCRGEGEGRALFWRTSNAVCIANGVDGLSWKSKVGKCLGWARRPKRQYDKKKKADDTEIKENLTYGCFP